MTSPNVWTPGGKPFASVNNSLQVEHISPTDGQQDFTLTEFTYSPYTNSIQVYLNGALQRSTIDYLETTNNSIRFLSANLVSSDTLTCIGLTEFVPTVPADLVGYQQFAITSTTDTLQITAASYVPFRSGLQVFVNGALQYPGLDYLEIEDSMIEFTNDLVDGDNVLVRFGVDSELSGDAAGITYLPAVVDGVLTTVQSKLSQFLSVTDFGVVGDGVTNDTVNLLNAITYCSVNKKRLYVPGGKTYLIDEIYLAGPYYVDMFSDPANRARFLSTSAAAIDGARQFRFIGAENVTGLTIAADIKPSQRTVTLSSVASLSVGMVLRITSNTFWPYDNRGSYTKGEIHEIIAINTGSNTVTFRDSTRDSYLLSETVDVVAWTPNHISLENFIFELPAEGVGTGGVQFTRAINARVTNCKAFGSTFYQFANTHCINTWYFQIEVGPFYNDAETGYGIYDQSSLGTTIRTLRSDGLRAAYDSHTTSTGQCPNRDAMIDGFVIYGGGVVFPDSSFESRGLGMHGPSENVRFINGFIADCQSGIRVRGKNTFVENITFGGRMAIGVACSHGTMLTVRNCVYDSYNYPNKIANLTDIFPASRLTEFIDFGIQDSAGNEWDYKSPVIIEGNTVLGLDAYFINFTRTQEIYNLTVRNNEIQAIPGTGDTAYLLYGASQRNIYSSTICDNKLVALNGAVSVANNNVYLGFSATAAIIDRAVRIGNDKWLLRVADDAVGLIRFDLTTGVDRPNVWLAGGGGGTKLFNIIAENATLTSWAGSTFATLVGTATGSSLTGTTGVDGNITVGLMNNGDFYLENRGGSTRTWRITLAA